MKVRCVSIGDVDVTCKGETRDCGTMNCTEVHYTCLLDLFSRYATVDSPDCKAMATGFAGLNEFDCYAVSCSHNRTATCLEKRYVEDCDMFPSMGARFAAAQIGGSSVANFATSADLTAQSIDNCSKNGSACQK